MCVEARQAKVDGDKDECMGLARCDRHCAGAAVKKDHALQCSFTSDLTPLSRDQQIYLALDALVPMQLYHVLLLMDDRKQAAALLPPPDVDLGAMEDSDDKFGGAGSDTGRALAPATGALSDGELKSVGLEAGVDDSNEGIRRVTI